MSSDCPMDRDSTCPMASHDQPNPLNMMPSPNQQPSPGQKHSLSTDRASSTIPMATKDQVWIYPSEQMFFNAMRRKKWDANEEDMKVVVPIHNAVNEQCWKRILEWEAVNGTECKQPKLLKFQGKPRDYSPKARMFQLLGYKLPFDRHDWTVDRCGTLVTYVIDFYSGADDNPDSVSFYLDVRPSLSSLQGIKDRFYKFFKTGHGLI